MFLFNKTSFPAGDGDNGGIIQGSNSSGNESKTFSAFFAYWCVIFCLTSGWLHDTLGVETSPLISEKSPWGSVYNTARPNPIKCYSDCGNCEP